MNELLRLENIKKTYPSPDGGTLEILSSVSFSLYEGASVAIVGRSGSGKSTLLSVAALLSTPDSGSIYYAGEDALRLSEKEKAALRAEKMGFVFQSSLLLSDFSALENTAMPLMINGMKRKEAFERASVLLDSVGLSGRKDHRPSSLSGGERQRTAIARALVSEPLVVFADEPTGSLDEKSAAEAEDILLEALRKSGRGMVLVTHNPDFASRCDRVLTLSGGVLYE